MQLSQPSRFFDALRSGLCAGALLLTACAQKPPPLTQAAHPACGIGWDDCAWQLGLNDT